MITTVRDGSILVAVYALTQHVLRILSAGLWIGIRSPTFSSLYFSALLFLTPNFNFLSKSFNLLILSSLDPPPHTMPHHFTPHALHRAHHTHRTTNSRLSQ